MNPLGQQKSVYGYSVNSGLVEDGFIHHQTLTAGSVFVSQIIDVSLLGDEIALYADAAYSLKKNTRISSNDLVS